MGEMDAMAKGFSPTSATPVSPSLDAPMPSPPSATYERLRETITERMRMSPINQPLMFMELRGHGVAWKHAGQRRRRIWPGGCRGGPWQAGC